MRSSRLIGILFAANTLLAQTDAIAAHLKAANAARSQKQWAEAEKEGAAAIAEAEKLGPLNGRLADALQAAGYTCFLEGKYDRSELLYFRATEIAEPAGTSQETLAYELDYLGSARLRQDKFPSAMAPYQRALAIREKLKGPDDPSLANLLSNLAAAQIGLSQWAPAEESLNRAVRIQEKLIGPDRANLANTLMQLGNAMQAQAKYPEAETRYRDALKIREALFGPDHASVGDSLSQLGDTIRHEGRYAEAEPLLRRSVAIREKAYGPNGPAVANSLNNLALALEALNKSDEAEKCFLRAIDIAGGDASDKGGRESRYMGNLSALYRRQQRLPEAQKLGEQAVAVREKALGADSLEMVYELENLVDTYAAENRYDAAEPLARRVLAIQEKRLGADNPQFAGESVRLGNVLMGERKFTDAEAVFRRALTAIEARFGPDHLQTAAYVENLARCEYRSGLYAEADPLYRRAIEIRRSHLPEAAARFATLENNYAVFLRAEGRYKEALALLEGINTADERKQPSSVWLENLADVYARLGYYSKAEPLLLQSMDSAQPGEGAPAHRLLRLGQLDALRQHSAEATASLEQVLSLSQKSGDTESQMAALVGLADVKRDSRQFAEAERLYNLVLAMRERETPDSPLLAEALDEMALSALRQGRAGEAEPPLLRAQRIFGRDFPFDNVFSGNVQNHLAMLYTQQKRFDEADPLFQKSVATLAAAMGADVPALAPPLREYARFLRLRNHPSEAASLEERARKLTQTAPVENAKALKK